MELLILAMILVGMNCLCTWEKGKGTCILDQEVPPTFDPGTHSIILNCSATALADILPLSKYHKLSELAITSCRIRNLLEICRLENLRSVNFYNTDLRELPQFPENCLRHATSISFRRNNIKSVQPGVFFAQESLSELILKENEISQLNDASFTGLLELQTLDLSNNGMKSLSRDPFRGLLRLVVLKLNNNRLRVLESGLLRDLSSLQELDLSNNIIERVDFGAFDNLQNLHSLKLANNKLNVIDGYTFRGLSGLAELELDYNNITRLANGSFRPFLGLTQLSLKGNNLPLIPRAIFDLTMLKRLDLSFNSIMSVEDNFFANSTQLVVLLINNNQLQSIMGRALYGLSKLEILEVANNRLELIEPGSLDGSENLQEIRFDCNFLDDINGLFRNLMKLRFVNLSGNGVQLFDYSFLPLSVEFLDLHSNEISEISNYYELETRMNLKFMDLSFNQISMINEKQIPNSVETILLNNNKIQNVLANTFSAKTNMTLIDLRRNAIQYLKPTAVWLRDESQITWIKLGQNPFICDCGLEWLTGLTNQSRHQPILVDSHDVSCHIVIAPEVPQKLMEVKSEEFLCKYESHCFALCHCCEFDACDCEMACPSGCRCYHDAAWGTNLVDCSSSKLSDIPSRVPMDVTHLRLDGNPLIDLGSHSFIGRKNLQILHINNSDIAHIQNRTFYGIPNVVILHMEYNLLVELDGGEFEPLQALKELYLQNNLLEFIPAQTFDYLKSLKILNLSGNKLKTLLAERLPPSLKILNLYNNPLRCEGCFSRSLASLSDQLEVESNMSMLFCTELTFMGTRNYQKLLELGMPCAEESASMAPVYSVDFVAIITASIAVLIVLLGCIVAIVLLKRDHLSLWLQAKDRTYSVEEYPNDNKSASVHQDYFVVPRSNRYEIERVVADTENEYMTISPNVCKETGREWHLNYPSLNHTDSFGKALYV
ncbi:toll-like receptor 6 [Artemia franciscana]|uniref:LRRNT domain-containing protein n=1 Tax=Artemia franciscana TaxID=6661 RepID=A0AA88LBX6_ARTSF|nr:hypothetical protein QYM36_010345 [Artemia franciscana]